MGFKLSVRVRVRHLAYGLSHDHARVVTHWQVYAGTPDRDPDLDPDLDLELQP